VRQTLRATRSIFIELKKLSIAELSQASPARLVLQVMNRAETKFALERFRDRLICASVADSTLAENSVQAMRWYVAELEDAFEAIDVWSVEEYERLREYPSNNQQWISEALTAKETLSEVHKLLVAHKAFLSSNGLQPRYLDERPNPTVACRQA
jgi:hypothetical protein